MSTNTTENKIKPRAELAKIIAQEKKKGKKVVLCHGVFDLVHLGHIRHFKQAKKEADLLIVSITKDKHVKRGPGRPVFNEMLRAETLASLAMTDYVSIVDSPTATDFIKAIKPDFYAKGNDYKAKDKDVTGKIYEEEDAIESVGGRLLFTDDITFSSSHLLNSYIDAYPPQTTKFLRALKKRFSADDVIHSLEKVKKLKALVIGDAIIDQYHYCNPMGKSSKEHLVVNKYESEEMFAGGTLATANNVASICGEVDMVTLLGRENDQKDFIESKLAKNVNPIFFYRDDANTIIKRRYVNQGSGRKLFEVCFMNDEEINKDVESQIKKFLQASLKKYDVVVVSDFGHGLLSKNLIKLICQKSKYLAVNVQTNSANIGFNLVTKYPSANCVCIDEMELRYATHDKLGDLRTHAKKVYSQMNCDHIIATRGPHGSICYSEEAGYHNTPAFAYRVVDAIGAGDAFFAYVGPCFAAGLPQELTAFVGNAVGSLAVQIVCNREPVNFVELSKFITRLLK